MYKINVLYRQSTDTSIYVEQGWIQEDVSHHICRQTQEGNKKLSWVYLVRCKRYKIVVTIFALVITQAISVAPQ